MTSARHLLSEDRPEFERILDQALHAAGRDTGPAPTAQQLRTMALGAVTAIASCAAVEYDAYVSAREALRRPAASAENGPGVGALGGLAAPAAEGGSAGVAAVVAVLAPLLSASAAVIFLLLGYVLGSLRPQPAVAQPIRTAGWFFALLTVATFVIAMAGLVLTALRNGSTSIPAGGRGEAQREVARARDEWRAALLERGIEPFLREALARGGDPGPDSPYTLRPDAHAGGRTPRLGYSRPGFSSPDEGSSATGGPRFSSPDFTSPDYGGPEHEPD
ncbi:hypothetical protein SRB5_29240 [Streptomyces sp. RB5]|uniref:Transmembrane protein n=1 Tax=Streptomyces smaragdinus TaxID=2585196 RepID=A0A7K0CH26_9ACTN|nr:hypothetical protein [Streptomyces smaragdinus]MQY12785.1 hypothetical protein [Streptomyces smaragdinus]